MRRPLTAIPLVAALAAAAPIQAAGAQPPPPAPAPPPDDLPAPWGMSLVDVQGRGVMVERLDLQSFAVPLLQPGDIILGVDERRVAMSAELRRYLRAAPAGKMFVFTIQRGHTRHYVMLQLPP